MLQSPRRNTTARQTILKPLVLAIQISLCASSALSATQVYANNGVQQYQIQPTTLRQALNAFALQAGVNISMNSDQLQNIPSQGLSGQYTLEQGFVELLKNTNFQLQKSSNGYVLVEKSKAPPSQTKDMGRLNTIDINTSGVAHSDPNALQLPIITVTAVKNGSAEDGYLVNTTKGIGIWDERSLQDTPYQISIASSDLIENTVARDLDQIYKMNPVVESSAPTTVFGYPSVKIRGFNTSSGVFDGLNLSSYSYGLSTEEIERVEVFNGLSGFMYGSGNVGGTANYVLKRPTYEKLTNLTVGNYGNQQWFGHLDLGNKIDQEGKFAYRLNIAYSDGETQKEGQEIEKKLISGAIDWNVSESLLLQLQAAHSDYYITKPDTRFYAISGLGYWPKAFDNKQTYTQDWNYNSVKSNRIGVNAKWQINDIFSLRSAYLYKEDEREHIISYPIYSPTEWSMYAGSKTTPYDTISQGAYIYLDSTFNTYSIEHKLTLGISTDVYKEVGYANGISDSTYIIPSGLSAHEMMNLASPNFSSTDWGAKLKKNQTQNMNVMIGDDITFNDQWAALIGLNYATLGQDSYGNSPSTYKESALTPTLSIIYKPTPDITNYISYIEGLEKGTVVPDDETLYSNPRQILDPYISKQYEIGSKLTLNQNILISSALFRIEKANAYNEVGADQKITVKQDGLQINQGAELTLVGKVTDDWTISAGGTYMQLEIDKATNKTLEGKKPTGSASKLAKIYSEYHVPTIEGLTFTGGAYYTGSKYNDSANLQKIDAYTLFDVGLRYETHIEKVPTSFAINVTNLTNKNYWTTTNQLGTPRTVAFSAKTKF